MMKALVLVGFALVALAMAVLWHDRQDKLWPTGQALMGLLAIAGAVVVAVGAWHL